MTVSSSTNKVSYNGNDVLTTFAYTFKIFDEDDLVVILRSSLGVETVQTITTDYTVTGVGDAGGGNVEFVTAPATGVTVVILREQPLTQGLDLVPNDPFPAQNLENSLDKLTFMVQQLDEEVNRAFRASRTATITTTEFTENATARANKVFAFDADGELDLTQEIGTSRGNWAASTSYQKRDLVTDTTNYNLYIANEGHTSSGSLPLSTNIDASKWTLVIDSSELGQLALDTTPQLGGNLDGNSFDIILDANNYLKWNDGSTDAAYIRYFNDTSSNNRDRLDFYHSTTSGGTGGFVQFYANGTSRLVIDADETWSTEKYTSDGGFRVSEYRAFGGIPAPDVYVDITSTAIDAIDNYKILLGTGDDLEIYHDATNSIINNKTGDLQLQSSGSNVLEVQSGGVEVTGYLRGPSTFTIDPAAHGDDTGTVLIAGNLQVDGTTTTINSTTLTVDDLNITLADGAATAAAANGAGITVAGASATITYTSGTDTWDFNKDLTITGATTSGDIEFGLADYAVFHNSTKIGYDGTNGRIFHYGSGALRVQADDLKLEASTSGDYYMTAADGGAVTLYYDNTIAAVTSSTGFDVTGKITGDEIDISQNGATTVKLGEQGSGDSTTLNFGKGFDTESAIWFQGGSNYGGLVMPNNENIVISLDEDNVLSGDKSFLIQGSGRTKTHLSVEETGNVQFYEDTGVTPKLIWFAASELLSLRDNVKLALGEGNDLELHHDTTNSIINNKTGDLQLQNSSSTKLTINSTGVDITGTLTSDGLTVDGSVAVNHNNITQTANSPRIDIMEADTTNLNTRIWQTAGDFRIYTLSDDSTTYSERIRLDHATGDISFYEDTGTTPKFFWDASAESLGIGTSSPVANTPLTLQGPSGYTDTLWLKSVGTNIDSRINIAPTGTGNAQINNTVGTAIEFQTSGTERMRIDSSGNVGIGTTQQAHKLSLEQSNKIGWVSTVGTDKAAIEFSGTDDSLRFYNNTGSTERMRITAAGGIEIPNQNAINEITFTGTDFTNVLSASTSGFQLGTTGAGYLAFLTNNSERMRIDSSGNLLVGHTSAFSPIGNGGSGVTATASGQLFAGHAGPPLYVNREDSDGDIAVFRKDGTTVGSIGVNSLRLYIGSSLASTDANIKFTDVQILPCDATGTNTDGTDDIGASAARFKDLYLSGGVYLGGTGAANKLDDYEEGTFTPTLGAPTAGTISYAYQYGSYTKIGRVVHFDVQFQVNSWTGHSGGLYISSLPFTVANYSFHRGSATIAFNTLFTFAESGTHVHVSQNNTKVFFYDVGSTYQSGSQVTTQDGSGYLQVSGWYNVA